MMIFKKLNLLISKYNNLSDKKLFYKKLFECFLEIEKRRNKLVIYLFEKQIFNLSTIKIKQNLCYYRYFIHLLKLRFVAKRRKIKAGFLITQIDKWNSMESAYNEMEKSKYFEPFVLLTYFNKPQEGISADEYIKKCEDFLNSKKIKYYKVFNENSMEFFKLKKYKPDIVFYQQPWNIHPCQSLSETAKNALTCYIPYCFYSLDSYINYMAGFHGCLWKYFVETDNHKKEYETKYSAKNCVVINSAKLDNYKLLNKNPQIWKSQNKKRIIYAPHHSFNDNIHDVATFKENGEFILQIAKNNPETEWIFKPHPDFFNRVLKNKILSLEQITGYYEEWNKIGSVYTGSDYHTLFQNSDCLITDCISFLAEYLPTQKPVIHLRKDTQKDQFNTLLNMITNTYYKVYDNETLQNIFEKVIINNDDYLKTERIQNIKYLITDNETSGQKIVKYLQKELKIIG